MYRILLSGILFLSSTAIVCAAENWQVVLDTEPGGNTARCLLESVTLTVEDGQTQTPVKLVYNGRELYAVTRSNIDLSYPNVGLTVDSKGLHKIGHLLKEKVAVFTEDVASIHQQFIDGARAKLALGFWPTWPKTQTRMMTFSLIGYKKAFQQYEQCLKTGNI